MRAPPPTFTPCIIYSFDYESLEMLVTDYGEYRPAQFEVLLRNTLNQVGLTMGVDYIWKPNSMNVFTSIVNFATAERMTLAKMLLAK